MTHADASIARVITQLHLSLEETLFSVHLVTPLNMLIGPGNYSTALPENKTEF